MEKPDDFAATTSHDVSHQMRMAAPALHQNSRRIAKGLSAASLALAAAAMQAGCARPSSSATCELCARPGPIASPRPAASRPKRHIGSPYFMNGKWFYPKADPTYDRIGIAAWMSTKYHGRTTANGEIHDSHALVAAHPTLPLPSYVMVTNLENGRSLVVRINDRGPFNKGRILDASRHVAQLLGYEHRGLARVRVRYLRDAPLYSDGSYELAYLSRQSWVRCAYERGRAVKCWARNRSAARASRRGHS